MQLVYVLLQKLSWLHQQYKFYSPLLSDKAHNPKPSARGHRSQEKRRQRVMRRGGAGRARNYYLESFS